eukprot:4153127-Pleurochrysis_carterae.AAC.1
MAAAEARGAGLSLGAPTASAGAGPTVGPAGLDRSRSPTPRAPARPSAAPGWAGGRPALARASGLLSIPASPPPGAAGSGPCPVGGVTPPRSLGPLPAAGAVPAGRPGGRAARWAAPLEAGRDG